MRNYITILFLCCYISSLGQNKLNAIGEWREQNSFDSIVNIINGDQIYITNGAEILGLSDNSFHLGKSSGLHNASIKKISWNPYDKSIFTIYNNNQIDIVKGDHIYGINDIYNTSLYSSKNINDVLITDFGKALLSTDFGIVLIDLNEFNVTETWFPNNQRNQEKTYSVQLRNDTLFVLTENGLKINTLKNHALSGSWSQIDQYKGCNQMVISNTDLWLSSTTSIYKFPSVSKMYNVTNGLIFKLISTNNQLYIIVNNFAGGGYYRNIRPSNTSNIADSSFGFMPLDIIEANKQQYVASNDNGLIAIASNNKQVMPGPLHGLSTQTIGFDNLLFTIFNKNNIGFSTYSEQDGWISTPYIASNNMMHYNNVAYQNNTKKIWLSNVSNKLFNWDPISNQYTTIPYDSAWGSILSLQSNALSEIWLLTDKGIAHWNGTSWQSVNLNSLPYGVSSIKDFIATTLGQIWIIPKNKQGLYVYQTKQKFNTETGLNLTTSSNAGNLPSTNVLAIAEDKKGSIWVGTDNGIGIMYPDDLSQSIPKAYLPIIKNNGFNGYLLQKENIHCITVNGANQKWIGTDKGAWLIAGDGNEILEHFTSTNSFLQDDTVLKITIIPETGEVFFISNKHASSYKAVATEPKEHLNQITIYPNPVPPQFGGQIAIKNLTENAIVKITDLNGKLVYQTRSQGGTAVWNGITYLGNKPSTGVYLVWIRDDAGEEKAVGKILFTSNIN